MVNHSMEISTAQEDDLGLVRYDIGDPHGAKEQVVMPRIYNW